MIDFDALVLKPATDVFAISVSITPLVTQPGAPAYPVRGVYSSSKLDVVMQDETIFSDQQTKLEIRKAEFPDPPPDRGDLVEITQSNHPAFGQRYWIGDQDLDGQGGISLLLRTQQPPDSDTTAPGPS
jgi:hypothetical protein